MKTPISGASSIAAGLVRQDMPYYIGIAITYTCRKVMDVVTRMMRRHLRRDSPETPSSCSRLRQFRLPLFSSADAGPRLCCIASK